MKYFSALVVSATLWLTSAPAATAQQATSPYRTRFAVDAPITLGLGAAGGLGLYLMGQKSGLSDAELAALDKNDVPKFDRFSAGNYSQRAGTIGDFLTYGSLVVAPGLLALDQDARGHYGQILGLYLQTMASSAAVFTLTAGTVTRYRPFLYGSEGSSRNSRLATNSFFSGHTAHTATATFFAAKVFHDFHPGSAAEPFVWGAAALVPAAVAYSRMEYGRHFLSDNIVGYAVGAAAGILVPQLHKTSGRGGLSFVPIQGLNINGHSYGGLLITKQL